MLGETPGRGEWEWTCFHPASVPLPSIQESAISLILQKAQIVKKGAEWLLLKQKRGRGQETRP